MAGTTRGEESGDVNVLFPYTTGFIVTTYLHLIPVSLLVLYLPLPIKPVHTTVLRFLVCGRHYQF